MRASLAIAGALVGALSLGSACTETSPRTSTVQNAAINSCDDGVAACEGNAACESCLIEGECAAGPSPVWTGEACVCTDDNPANCVYDYCCALGFEWNPEACECLPCGDEEDDDTDSDSDHDVK